MISAAGGAPIDDSRAKLLELRVGQRRLISDVGLDEARPACIAGADFDGRAFSTPYREMVAVCRGCDLSSAFDLFGPIALAYRIPVIIHHVASMRCCVGF